ncbi:acetyl-CoA C-acetyltransferase [Vibrio sp. SCSIO 43140]|uniref:acetyl-CoA C-acetyltransferase n=1 Tax=Vibrio sp. SCSIO 43140 TaxID=2819100 RepID=UPI0020755D62|nr:acetyl-CoA C-acetyltransferase [Vibrio sp. SCSIO 43140]USD62049.1 acetyl-CoA C-acetyltransferase [Vibrio sp. SCSIO 43140]
MEKVFIVAAKRTAIGSFGGTLKNISAGDLAATAIKGALDSTPISVEDIDEVIVGNVVSANQGMGIGRQASIKAGIPAEVPAYTLNMVCGSGMKTLMDAASHIKAGEAEIVVAAGVEVMSQIPFAMPATARSGHKMGDMTAKDLLVADGLTDVFNAYHMGVTAENIAKQVDISRDDQDAYALSSQQKAVAAIEAGKFNEEIVPVEVKVRRNVVEFATDEYPKVDATMEGLAKLRPAFDREGSVTAGNASGINDGASALIVASESVVTRLGLTPLCELVASAQTGLDPQIMGLGPVQAVTNALSKAEVAISDVNVFELNEAFAAQALGVIRNLASEHGVSAESILQKANPNGGAIALGHPLGASGNRIIVTLIHEMLREKKNLGVASLCVGGGMGTAVVVKRC